MNTQSNQPISHTANELFKTDYKLMAMILAGHGLITRLQVDGDVILNSVKEPLREPS